MEKTFNPTDIEQSLYTSWEEQAIGAIPRILADDLMVLNRGISHCSKMKEALDLTHKRRRPQQSGQKRGQQRAVIARRLVQTSDG